MNASEANLQAARYRMVAKQLRGRGIGNERLLAAFMDVPRERFLPPERVGEAYGDHPVPIGRGQTISQPYVVALMIEQLDPQGGDRVLDIGLGSGYQAAILARLVGRVYGIERIEALAERARRVLAETGAANVTVHVRDGSLGLPEEAPFDGVICGAAAPQVPPAWVEQLVEGGRIVMPIGGRHVPSLLVARKRGGRLHRRELGDVRFVKLIGRHGWPEEATGTGD